jgi:hypothetical protein
MSFETKLHLIAHDNDINCDTFEAIIIERMQSPKSMLSQQEQQLEVLDARLKAQKQKMLADDS